MEKDYVGLLLRDSGFGSPGFSCCLQVFSGPTDPCGLVSLLSKLSHMQTL